MYRKINYPAVKVLKQSGILAGCFATAMLLGRLGKEINIEKITNKTRVVHSTDMFDVEDVMKVLVDVEDLSPSEQDRLNGYLNFKTYELSIQETAVHLEASTYQVVIVSDLNDIPQEYRTPALQVKVLNSETGVILDEESGHIWCEYDAPECALTNVILGIG